MAELHCRTFCHNLVLDTSAAVAYSIQSSFSPTEDAYGPVLFVDRHAAKRCQCVSNPADASKPSGQCPIAHHCRPSGSSAKTASTGNSSNVK